MAELCLREKKPRKAKKKKRYDTRLLSLSNIPEEASSSQDIVQICQNAAETVVTDSMITAVHLNTTHSNELLLSEKQTKSTELVTEQEGYEKLNHLVPNEALNYSNEHKSSNTEIETKAAALDDPLIEAILDDITVAERESISAISSLKPACISEEPSREHLSLSDSVASLKQESSLEIAKVESTSDTVGTTELVPVQKLSVFVGKDTLYNSSLQLGCQWDRSKYNIVLLPELGKVVYPDLDAILYNKPLANPFCSHALQHEKYNTQFISVDRSCKPNKESPGRKTERGEHDVSYTLTEPDGTDIISAVNKVDTPNASNMMNMKQDYRYTDCRVDGIDFRVFMNPIKWTPVDGCQQVIFSVGPVYYEEYFVNCGSTEGLVKAIKERADNWAQHQLSLAQTCLLAEFNNSHSFRINNKKLVIYGSPLQFDWESDWQVIRFGLDDAFYQENLQGCKSFEDAIKIVKNRAELICREQSRLKAKAYSSQSSSVSANLHVGKQWSDSDFDSDSFEECSRNGKDQCESMSNEATSSSKTADKSQKRSFKDNFRSFRNWLKGAFSKKTDKGSTKTGSEPQKTNPGESGSKNILWQWNGDSPEEVSSSAILREDLEHLREG